MDKKWVKAYKGFNKDMTCRGFIYPESGEVHVSDDAKLCRSGVHACEAPIDCLRYYSPNESIYREVEIAGDTGERECNDTKICGTDIRIGAKLDIAGLVDAQIEYVKAHVTNDNNAKKGKSASAGVRGAASAGAYGAASAGEYGAASAGESGAASAGESGAASAGESGAASAGASGAASAGAYGAASAGVRGAASAGVRGAASAGESGAASAGEYGAASAGESGAASAGESGAASAGAYGAASAGAYGAASAGASGAASAGAYGAASAGASGAAVSRGKASVGNNGAALARGCNVCAKGGLGSLLLIVEENDDDYNIKSWCAGIVDGISISPDTWYQCKDGKFVKLEDAAE